MRCKEGDHGLVVGERSRRCSVMAVLTLLVDGPLVACQASLERVQAPLYSGSGRLDAGGVQSMVAQLDGRDRGVSARERMGRPLAAMQIEHLRDWG